MFRYLSGLLFAFLVFLCQNPGSIPINFWKDCLYFILLFPWSFLQCNKTTCSMKSSTISCALKMCLALCRALRRLLEDAPWFLHWRNLLSHWQSKTHQAEWFRRVSCGWAETEGKVLQAEKIIKWRWITRNPEDRVRGWCIASRPWGATVGFRVRSIWHKQCLRRWARLLNDLQDASEMKRDDRQGICEAPKSELRYEVRTGSVK